MTVFNSHKIFQGIEDFQTSGNVLVDNGGKIVFTNGCFDIFHVGHVNCLESSKGAGDILIVGLNDDDSVRRLKGSERPINSWMDRAAILAALSCVDVVIGFSEDTPLELIRTLRPSVITKGGDYSMGEMIGKDFVESYGGEIIIFPHVEGRSSTGIIQKLKK